MRQVIYVLLAALVVPTVGVAGDIVTDGKFKSTQSSGAPLEVASADMVLDLNADMVDGVHGTEIYTKAEVDALVDAAVDGARTIIAYVGGNLALYLPTEVTVVKSVTITVPSAGIIEVDSEGYVKFTGSGRDYFRGSITTSTTSLDPEYLQVVTDLGSTNTSDGDYIPISSTRVYAVNAGTYTFNLLAQSIYEADIIRVDDVNMTAVFYPNPPALKYAVMPSIESQETSWEESERMGARSISGE